VAAGLARHLRVRAIETVDTRKIHRSRRKTSAETGSSGRSNVRSRFSGFTDGDRRECGYRKQGAHRVVFLSSDDEDATARVVALAKQLGSHPSSWENSTRAAR